MQAHGKPGAYFICCVTVRCPFLSNLAAICFSMSYNKPMMHGLLLHIVAFVECKYGG